MAWDTTKTGPYDGSNDDTSKIKSADWNDLVTALKLRGSPANDLDKRGSDCTGVDGALGRVLTLSNTTLTKTAGVMVFRSGGKIMNVDLTITHNTSGSTVAFDNVNIFDTDYIDVYYFE